MRPRFVLAVLFALSTLAVASSASASPDRGKTFVLFHETWCIGDVSPLTSCDVSLGRSATMQRVTTGESLKGHDPIDALRQVTHAGARTTAAPLVDLRKLEQRLNWKTGR